MRKATVVALIAVALVATAPGDSAAQYFGKNKVQYRSFDWTVLETDHFEIYFYEHEREVAVDAARMAERAYAKLSRVLDHEIENKVPLILYASHTDFQSSNVTSGMIHEGTGGLTEFVKRRVTLPFTGSYAELDHVLTHELVHAFQIDILFSRAENVLANPMSFSPPLWFIEGMAEYLSLNEIDNHTAMWLRDGALQGYLTSIPELNMVGDIRVYRYGQSVLEYIGRRYGDEKIGEILKKAVFMKSLNRAFEDVVGINMQRLSDDWTQDVRRRYLPTIADHLKPDEFARALTNHGQDLSNMNLAASASPNGDRFAFISDRSLYNDLYLASAIDGEIDRRLIKGERTGDFESLRFFSTSISWSPDGRHLALPAKEGGEDVLVIFDVEENRQSYRHKVGLDGLRSPSWSPDGEGIVFVGLQGGRSDLFAIDVDGTNLEQLTDSRHAARDPQWSPDGRTIAFTTDIGPETDFERLAFGDFVVGLLDLESGEVEVPPGQSGKSITPQWSPEGDRLVFVSDRNGISNIYVMDIDGSNVEQLTDVLSGITGITASAPAISLSRDGTRLLFTGYSRGGFDVYAIDHPFGAPEVDDTEPAPEAFIVDAAGVPAISGARVIETPTADGGESGAVADIGIGTETDKIAGHVIGLDGDEEAPAGPDSLGSPMPTLAAETDVDEPASLDEPVAALDDPSATSPSADSFAGTQAGEGEPDIEIGTEEVALPDSTSFTYRKYRLRFSPDFVSANGLFASNIGLAAQTAIGFSDVLGNHRFVVGASVYGSLLDSDILLSYINLSRRTNFGVSLFQYRNDFFLFQRGDNDELVSQIYRGVELAVSRPFNLFRRLEFGLELIGVEERVFTRSFYTGYGPSRYVDLPGEGSHYFARPRAALVFDNVLYGSTGPISGRRSRLEAEQAVGGLKFTTLSADYRRYSNIRKRYVLAFRTVGITSFGEYPETFRVGGPYTLRGLEFGEERGTSIMLTNLEFRFPLIDYVKFGWPLPLSFGGIRGLMFFDAGAAWSNPRDFKPIGGDADRSGFYLNDVKASYGFGARMNFLGFLIARWDVAKNTDLRRGLGPWKGRFSLGAEF